jgi:hypothetical protein
MRTLTAALILGFAGILGIIPAMAAEAPHSPQEPFRRPVASSSTTSTTQPPAPPRRALEASDGQSCPGWMDVAREVGWPEQELAMVGAVTYFESRCRNDVRGDHGKSWTAWQIHTKSWCRPTRWYPNGYLQSLQIVTTCEDLLNPHTAARAALAIWQYGGWKQWTTWKMASTTIGQ